MRAVLSSLAMVLAMVKAPGDVVGDDPSVRLARAGRPAPGARRRGRRPRAQRPRGGGRLPGRTARTATATASATGPATRARTCSPRCGTPLRAATTATVRLVDEDGAAGRYSSCAPRGGRDLVYMHLSDVDVTAGEQVRAGERVGAVGQTGNATTCHLHFEVWSAPGWYAGGAAPRPVAMLRSRERSASWRPRERPLPCGRGDIGPQAAEPRTPGSR